MSLRDRKTARKKEEIIRTAVSIVAEKGYQGTTMEDIASALLMTKGSMYYYFKDKQDLLYQSHQLLLRRSIREMEHTHQQNLSIKEKLTKSLEIHMGHLIEEQSGFEMMLKPGKFFKEEQLHEIMKLQREYSHCFDRLLEEGIQQGVFLPLDKKIARNILIGAMNWMTQWYDREGKKDKEEMMATMSEYLLRMLQKQI